MRIEIEICKRYLVVGFKITKSLGPGRWGVGTLKHGPMRRQWSVFAWEFGFGNYSAS